MQNIHKIPSNNNTGERMGILGTYYRCVVTWIKLPIQIHPGKKVLHRHLSVYGNIASNAVKSKTRVKLFQNCCFRRLKRITNYLRFAK